MHRWDFGAERWRFPSFRSWTPNGQTSAQIPQSMHASFTFTSHFEMYARYACGPGRSRFSTSTFGGSLSRVITGRPPPSRKPGP